MNRFKKYDNLKPLFSELSKEVKINRRRINDPKDDDMISFYPDYEFLRANAELFTKESFVYMYALSDEEREFVDQVRQNKDQELILKK